MGMGLTKMYLISYNLACMLGWAFALVLATDSLLSSGGDLRKVWDAAATPLLAAQWAMCMEMIHAATGAVRSPVFTVVLQVMSRINVVVIVALAPSVRTTWTCGLMALSWSLVEVVRYAFYVNGLVGPGGQAGTLYPVFWLRYSLFAILYPSGITGELVTMYTALSDPAFKVAFGGVAVVLVKVLLASYVPGAPFMYMNMVKNRKSAFKKRFAPPPPPPKAPVGAEFPEDGKGGRSTSEVGKKAVAAALAGGASAEAKEASTKCLKERNWRFGYHKHVAKLVRIGCSHPDVSAGIAKAGLRWMYENMLFHSADQSLTGAFGATVDQVKGSFHTGSVQGTKSSKDLVYTIPYDGGWHPTKPQPPPPGSKLSGETLKQQAFKWAEQGIIEPDAADALCWTSDYFAGGKSLNGVYVVMVGAGSAMGPFPKLLEMGATVVAIDIPGSWGKGTKRPTSSLWKRLYETAMASPGALIFPLSKPQSECTNEDDMFESAGCDCT